MEVIGLPITRNRGFIGLVVETDLVRARVP